MNSVLQPDNLFAPHLLQNPRLSPTRTCALSARSQSRRRHADHCPVPPTPTAMTGRKRKADDEDERMSTSPSGSPSMPTRTLAQPQRTIKRLRTNLSGRPLPLPRLLETLSADELRNVLSRICERHPAIGEEVVSSAPRPSIASVISVLGNYEDAVRAAFPFGGRSTSDYAYNRVRQALVNEIDAIKDYLPRFLPPNETQVSTSLSFLDSATEVVHRLPNWDTYQHNRHKQDAYEELGKAWAIVVSEAAKRGAGIQLMHGGWDQKLEKHNQLSGGKMEEAMHELRSIVGWMASGGEHQGAGPSQGSGLSRAEVRQQLLDGTYGAGPGSQISVGPW